HHARDLPWRRTRDPYAVWISEIMLQQTTVTAVIPYYERFLAAFPTVFALAAADEHDVLKLWEGLGYYSRGRNLHKAARVIVEKYRGEFPSDAVELQGLPGIGRYTAGAIASFAFDTRAPIVEANTLRLYSRLLGYRGDPRSTAGQQLLWDFAGRVLPASDCGRVNQALMELGATVCTPSDPQCPACPLQRDCIAFRSGAQHDIPVPKPRPAVTQVVEAAIAVRRNGRYLLRQRQPNERWAGLWDFPRFELSRGEESKKLGNTDSVRAELSQRLAELTGLNAAVETLVTEFSHSVTRYRIRLLCFQADCRSGSVQRSETSQWVRPSEFGAVALSVSGRRFARLLGGQT
ncbi:MAG: A/G-specific adenine glycosylase, partial [Planctomycetaceae bacterium]|nr:A/G-specific adenine glycosylase [Planctomycetaceae bacterium]